MLLVKVKKLSQEHLRKFWGLLVFFGGRGQSCSEQVICKTYVIVDVQAHIL